MASIDLEVEVLGAQALSEEILSLKIKGEAETTTTTTTTTITSSSSVEVSADIPAHRSHNPSNNLKRSDPFQFGSRYLEAGDDVFEFNAWDHVETDDAYKLYTQEQIEKQRQSPVSDFDKGKHNSMCLFRTFCLFLCTLASRRGVLSSTWCYDMMIPNPMHSSSEYL